MPRQEEESMKRIQKIASILKENEVMDFEELEAWCQINQGITGRTVGRYINALDKLGVIDFDPHTRIIKYVKKEKQT